MQKLTAEQLRILEEHAPWAAEHWRGYRESLPGAVYERDGQAFMQLENFSEGFGHICGMEASYPVLCAALAEALETMRAARVALAPVEDDVPEAWSASTALETCLKRIKESGDE